MSKDAERSGSSPTGAAKPSRSRRVAKRTGKPSAKASRPKGRKPDRSTATAAQKIAETSVRIVAIGASAGGLEPIEQLFEAMPTPPGLAFVIVQHLSPNFQSMMDQLIARHTKMRIVHAEDQMFIEPNVIYLNPPRTELSIKDGRLKATAYPDNDMLSLPIDAFFSSLAHEEGEQAIGIVLSGTGSDGTRGSLQIIQHGGVVIAQDPATAKFDSMPRKVIETIASAFSAKVSDMPDILKAIITGTSMPLQEKDIVEESDPEARILTILQKAYGTDFTQYKQATIHRRIQRRALLKRLSSLDDYCDALGLDKEEMDTLYCDLLIGVTEFFRDKGAFESLKTKVLPDLVGLMAPDRQLRLWVPGCATGEEPYSIAILICELAKEMGIAPNLKIFATDIHFRSLEFAANGSYSAESVSQIPETSLATYFEISDGRYKVRKSLRRHVVFSTQNLLKDPPFTKIDIISCRNLLIYFNDQAQRKVLSLFHFSLRKNGYLFLGSSETVGNLDMEFSTLDKRWRIFQKKRNTRLHEQSFLLPTASSVQDDTADGLSLRDTRSHSLEATRKERLARQALYGAYDRLLERYAPTGFLISEQGELVHVFGHAEKFLHVRKGLFSNRLSDMVVKDLRLVINAGIERALSIGHEVEFERAVQIEGLSGHKIRLTVRISKIVDIAIRSTFLLIILEEREERFPDQEIMSYISPAPEADMVYAQRIRELENELKSIEESLQTTIEELETSNEELQATNEELTASNEELQSTNEELHSVNEELYTVSAEHQRKIVELTELTDDMENLLLSTEIGTIFVDKAARIRRFTPASTKAFNLVPHDIGRPISHVTCRFNGEGFYDDILDTIKNGRQRSLEVECDGVAHLITVLPYRTEQEQVSGAVITIFEINDLKRAKEQANKEREFYKAVVDLQSDLVCRFKPDYAITFANTAFMSFFNIEPGTITRTFFHDLFVGSQREDLLQAIRELEKQGKTEWNCELPGSTNRWLLCQFSLVRDEADHTVEIQTVIHNVTESVEREKMMVDFNHIAADSSLDLDDKIRLILKRVSEVSHLPAALKLSFSNQQFIVKQMIGLDDTDIALRQAFGTPCTECGNLLGEGAVMSCSGNLMDCVKDNAQILRTYGYVSIIGSPIISNNATIGAIMFASRYPVSKFHLETYQPIIDRISDWIGYELFRRDQQQKLELLNNLFMEEEERFRKLYMETPVIMHSLDKDGTIVEANQKWLTSLGYEREEVIGHHWEEFMTEASTRYAYEVVIPEATRNKQADNILFQMRKKNGDVIDVEMSTVIVADNKGIEQTRTVLVDVSGRIRAEKELEAHNQELKIINDNLNQFTHIISHDLAGPLRAIQHTATWIEEDLEASAKDEIQEHIDRLKFQISHLGSLISDLSDYSKAGSNLQEAEELDLATSLRNMFAIIDKNRDISMEVDLLVDTIHTFRAPLMLVFRNLVENAIKYHDKDHGTVRITQEDLGKTWRFAVIDDGPGIDPRHHSKILLPFRKLERKDKIPGNGMGLALVKKAIESLGGTFTIISDPARQPGTTFRFTWPKKSAVS
ncbi:CheR family methyltransferase [uncultured Cohaesibacter sp.]|uniref:CheR family methyltransferase n=1 Tax=uncultured Cohaesibacter sp. TaxID=1002546 RepID=UPI0029C90D66|nr:CheR family methyltransferase [uncultured Cohaesibacter sp.]